MRLRLLFALAVLALPLASFQAAAQGAPTMTLSLSGPPTASLNAGATHSASFTGYAEIQAQCPNAKTIELSAALTNAGSAPAGVTPTLEPANITIDIPQGVHGPVVPGLPVDPTPTLNVTLPSLTLRVVTNAAASGVFPAAVSVSWAGGDLGPECIGNMAAASATVNHQVTIVPSAGGNATTPPGTTPPPGGNNTGGNNTGAPPPPANTPGFEPLVLAGALALVAVAARRRKA